MKRVTHIAWYIILKFLDDGKVMHLCALWQSGSHACGSVSLVHDNDGLKVQQHV